MDRKDKVQRNVAHQEEERKKENEKYGKKM